MVNKIKSRSFSIKTIISFTVTLFCLFLMSNDAFTQEPANNEQVDVILNYYEQVDGIFKQEGGTVILTIKRLDTEYANGVTKKGISVSTNKKEPPDYFIQSIDTDKDFPNKYVLELNSIIFINIAYVFTSNDKVEYRSPRSIYKYERDVISGPIGLNINQSTLVYEEDIFVDGNVDTIKLQIWQRVNIPSDKIEVSFTKEASITYWKGITVMNEAKEKLGSTLELKDSDNGPNEETFDSSSFSGDSLVIEIYKAKFLGIHWFQKNHSLPLSKCKGGEIIIHWVNDK